MKNRYAFILIALIWSHVAFAASWAGTWVFKWGPGAVPSQIVFSQEGHQVQARWEDGLSLKNLKVEGDTLSSDQGGDPAAFAYTGKLSGDTLVLSSNYMISGDYPGEDMKEFHHIVARRVSATELQKLAADTPKTIKNTKLPLPALRNLPDNGLARSPPMGWGNWVGTNDKTVREIADTMVREGFREAGYVYLVIDSGWQGNRDAEGFIHPNENFPDMTALADYVHTRGLKLGLYSSPGPLDCTGRLGSHGYENEDAKTYAWWGIDYLKYDWCSADKIYKTQAEVQAVYQKMGDAMRATGRPIVYSLCQYGEFDVGSWARKVGGNLWRTTADINNNYASMSENGFDNNGPPQNAGTGGWNDPDDLQVGKGMTRDEDRTQMSLWAIVAAPLLMSTDPRHVKPEVKKILLNKEVIAVDQDPLGKQGRRVKRLGTTEIWVKPLSDGSAAVGIFNRGDENTRIDVRWSELGLTHAQMARDLWTHTDLGQVESGYGAAVPAHGVVLLRLSSAR